MSSSSSSSSFGGSTSSQDYGKTYEPGTSNQSTGSGSGSNSSLSGGASTQLTGQAKKEAHTEGTVAKTIEEQTAKLPSDLFLWAALGSMGVSAALHFAGSKDQSRFVGQWVAPLLLFGVYNKIVKTQGSDRTDR